MELTLFPNPYGTSSTSYLWELFNYRYMTSNKDPRTDGIKIGALLLSTVFNILQLLARTTVLSIPDLLFFCC